MTDTPGRQTTPRRSSKWQRGSGLARHVDQPVPRATTAQQAKRTARALDHGDGIWPEATRAVVLANSVRPSTVGLRHQSYALTGVVVLNSDVWIVRVRCRLKFMVGHARAERARLRPSRAVSSSFRGYIRPVSSYGRDGSARSRKGGDVADDTDVPAQPVVVVSRP